MNTYNSTFIRLENKGFIQDKETIQDIGVTLFRNDTLNVILQNLEVGMDIGDIKEETIYIREKLHETELNVWNTYYILCADKGNIKSEKMLFIERDSSGLRKYVIKNDSDLNRILFLDNIPVNKIENPIKIQDSIPENDVTIKSMFKFIEDNEGTEKIISNEHVNQLLDKFL